MELYVNTIFMFLETVNQIWDAFRDASSQEKNILRIHHLYEEIFGTKQNGKPLSEHYASLKGIWEELNVYQPLSADIQVQRSQREEFQVDISF